MIFSFTDSGRSVLKSFGVVFEDTGVVLPDRWYQDAPLTSGVLLSNIFDRSGRLRVSLRRDGIQCDDWYVQVYPRLSIQCFRCGIYGPTLSVDVLDGKDVIYSLPVSVLTSELVREHHVKHDLDGFSDGYSTHDDFHTSLDFVLFDLVRDWVGKYYPEYRDISAYWDDTFKTISKPVSSIGSTHLKILVSMGAHYLNGIVTLPLGWYFTGEYFFDNLDRCRGCILHIDGHLYLNCRYRILDVPGDGDTKSVDVFDWEKSIQSFPLDFALGPDSDGMYFDEHGVAVNQAISWVEERYPLHNDPIAYQTKFDVNVMLSLARDKSTEIAIEYVVDIFDDYLCSNDFISCDAILTELLSHPWIMLLDTAVLLAPLTITLKAKEHLPARSVYYKTVQEILLINEKNPACVEKLLVGLE